MRYFSQQKLDQLLAAHAEWLQEPIGEALSLRNCDLRGMDLRGRSLMRMQFENVVLAGCDLRDCNFWGQCCARSIYKLPICARPALLQAFVSK